MGKIVAVHEDRVVSLVGARRSESGVVYIFRPLEEPHGVVVNQMLFIAENRIATSGQIELRVSVGCVMI